MSTSPSQNVEQGSSVDGARGTYQQGQGGGDVELTGVSGKLRVVVVYT